MSQRYLSNWSRLGSVVLNLTLIVIGQVDTSAFGEDAPLRGSLVICGGGEMPADVRARFIELAGGAKARFVVIPTASASAETDPSESWLKPWKTAGVESATIFHTRSRDKANDPEFVRTLDTADAVWISGGDQSKLTEAYLDTLVEKKLEQLLARGGVIGGTSAGAACMTRVMITGGRETASLGRGFDFFPGSVVDQHFLRRNRLGRLIGVVHSQPELTGVGIDESTAAVVRNGKLEVVGRSFVLVIRSQGAGKPTRLDAYHNGDSIVWPSQSQASASTSTAPVKP